MDHHERVVPYIVGDLYPAHHVQAVLPSELRRHALGKAVVVEVRQQHVVAEGVPVQARQVEHPHIIGGIAVDEDDAALGLPGSGTVRAVQLVAAFSHYHRVLEDAGGGEAVVPGRAALVVFVIERLVTLDVLPVVLRLECIIAHHLAKAAA